MIVGRRRRRAATTNGWRAERERRKINREGGNESGECGGLRFRERIWISEVYEIRVAVPRDLPDCLIN